MQHQTIYDCAIVGGGLAGLCLSIQLAVKGHRVILFEKEQYPFHKVCGEYISMESWDFLQSLGLPLKSMQLPKINKLVVSAPGGNVLSQTLPLGGFGISRYTIDNKLKQIAIEAGVYIHENCKVDAVDFENEQFHIKTSAGVFKSKTCCGCFGKRSNLDVKWKRPFILKNNSKLNNYIGVKYHVHLDFDTDTIALHNFKDGYCGLSKIEDDRYCVCYLTNAANLKANNNSIELMEKNILSKNPHLKKIFEKLDRIYEEPLSISQISFDPKSQVEGHVLMIGDAAGMITPLCGNGMSIAMHASKIAALLLDDFLLGKTSRKAMENNYAHEWKRQFNTRIRTGRMVQRFFGKEWTTNLFVGCMKLTPALTRWIIRQTHGNKF